MVSCASNTADDAIAKSAESIAADKTEFYSVLQKHLDAVSNKNLDSLASTLSPEGKMQLILEGSEVLHTVDSFLLNQKAFFEYGDWTFETRIVNTDIGQRLGLATVEIIYREAERNGEPYFNRMTISYALEKVDGSWYVIKDHASSVEKSTDKK